MKQTEMQIVRGILALLDRVGIIAERHNSGKIKIDRRLISLGTAGMPDIVGCLPGGWYLAIEVKTPERRKNLTTLQTDTLARLKKQGAVVFVACSLDDVTRELCAAGYYL